MIVPVPARRAPGRPRPWVTFALLTLCAALHLASLPVAHRRLSAAASLLAEAERFQAARPYLVLPPGMAAALGKPRGGAPTPGAGGEYAALEQAELDGLSRTAVDAAAQTPHGRWGIVPARFSLLSLFTHSFLHAGLAPLLGNLLLLWLLAPFLEEAWGPAAFGAFWLLAGAAAGAVFAATAPGLELPFVGASGAGAAVAGAAAVRFRGRRLGFEILRGRSGRWDAVKAASWLVVPLWAARVGLSWLGGDVAAAGGAEGFGPWAQAGGFAFGAAAAAAAQSLRLEERLGRSPRTAAGLWPPVVREPLPAGQAREPWSSDGEREPAALVRDLLRAGEPAEAYARWRLWQGDGCRGPLAPAIEVRLAEELLRAGDREGSAAVARGALDRAGAEIPTGVLSRLAELAAPGDRARVAALLLGRPDLAAGDRRRMEIWAAESPAPGPQGRPAAAPPPLAVRDGGGLALAPARVIPLELKGGTLVVEVGGRGPRALDLRRVRAVAAAAVDDGTSAEPELILDLFLEDPRRVAGAVNLLRVETFRWDPRGLLPTEPELEDAFLSFAGAVLAASGACWLLGESSRRLSRYRSLEAYERSLLSVLRLSLAPGP